MSLTKYPEGSLKELLKISFPLMLSSFSVMFMLFIDRILLANYSVEALNAAVNATTVGWVCLFGWMVLCGIAEVFVAQYNGAGQYEFLGKPVWQTIWLSFTSLAWFIPLGFFAGQYLFAASPYQYLENEYFKWMMWLGPTFPLYSALCGFFVGQGKTLLVTVLSVVGNLINCGMDYLLIFGVEGYFPSLGIAGAAIATSFSGIIQTSILACIFLNQSNRQHFGTRCWTIDFSLFRQIVKIGLPSAIFVAFESLGFATFYQMMTAMGEKYITIAGICQSLIILFYFFGEGLNKGATAVAGNLIGAKRSFLVAKVLRAGIILNLIFYAMIVGLAFSSIHLIAPLFLPHADPSWLVSIHSSLATCIYLILTYVLFEGIRLLLAGLLTAAGDTFFLLIAGAGAVWVFLVLPVYLFVVKANAPMEVATLISVIYGAVASLIYFQRFRNRAWEQKLLVSELEINT